MRNPGARSRIVSRAEPVAGASEGCKECKGYERQEHWCGTSRFHERVVCSLCWPEPWCEADALRITPKVFASIGLGKAPALSSCG